MAVEEDTSRLRIIWEGSNGSNDSFAELSSNNIFAPLPGYSIFVMDNNLDILPVMVRCRAVFIPAMGGNMTVATSDVAYIMSTEGSGNCVVSMYHRSRSLSFSLQVIFRITEPFC